MMIQISSKDTLYMYNLYHIVKAFFPNEEISQNLDEKQESLVSVKLEENSCFYVPVSEIADCPDRQDGKKKVTKLVYDWLSKVTGRILAWCVRFCSSVFSFWLCKLLIMLSALQFL